MSIDFEVAFHALTGNANFPWQKALFERFIHADRDHRFPDVCDIPTGLGKTSVIAIWLSLSAADLESEVVRRRLFAQKRLRVRPLAEGKKLPAIRRVRTTAPAPSATCSQAPNRVPELSDGGDHLLESVAAVDLLCHLSSETGRPRSQTPSPPLLDSSPAITDPR